MKKIFMYLFVLTSAIFCLSSCENGIIEEPELNPSPKTLEEFSFFYKGEEYTGLRDENGKISFPTTRSDKAGIIESLTNNPNLATFVYPDSTLEYFDSYKELTDKFETPLPATRASYFGYTLTAKLYDATKCKGAYYKCSTSNYTGGTEDLTVNLVPLNWANKISSFDLLAKVNYYPELDDHSYNAYALSLINNQGRSVTFCVTNQKQHSYIHYLDRYIYFQGSNEHWNDKARSIRLWHITSMPQQPPPPIHR